MSTREVRPGVLAVWNSRGESIANLYEDWYVNQHLPERVGLPGWLYGRRYEAVGDATPYFTYYRLESPAAAYSDAYLARLNDPTPETVKVMQNWGDMTRTSCELVFEAGETSGAYVVVARFYDAPPAGALMSIAEGLWQASAGVNGLRASSPLYVQLWQVHAADAPKTSESDVRATPDREVKAALVIDVMREPEAAAVSADLMARLSAANLEADHIDTYRFLCERR